MAVAPMICLQAAGTAPPLPVCPLLAELNGAVRSLGYQDNMHVETCSGEAVYPASKGA